MLFAGEGERIEIKHQAHSRQSFAAGVITAVRWLCSQQNIPKGVYGMKDVLKL